MASIHAYKPLADAAAGHSACRQLSQGVSVETRWRPGGAEAAYIKALLAGTVGAAVLMAIVLALGRPIIFSSRATPLEVSSHILASHTTPGIGPHDWLGGHIDQKLAEWAAQGRNIQLQGDHWEPMEIQQSKPTPKGPLGRLTTALVIIDMQPLFFDSRSPWARPGLLDQDRLWPSQLALARKLANFSGRNDSTFLTRYQLPCGPQDARGAMQHFYNQSHMVTRNSLAARGVDVERMFWLIAPLQALVAVGAQLADKPTFGAFGQGSSLPRLLDTYFASVNAREEQEQVTVRTLIVAGVETDMCVVSTVLGAIDAFYRVVVATDAIGSTQRNSGQAQLDYTLRRFDHLIDFGSSHDIMSLLE